MSQQIQQHIADAGAAISTGAVAAYTFTDILHDAALVVAIVSGTLAAAWHAHKLWQAYRGKHASTTSTESGADKDTPRGRRAEAE